MLNVKRRLLLACYVVADLCVVALAFGVVYAVTTGVTSASDVRSLLATRVQLSDVAHALLFAFAWHLCFRTQGLYRSHRIGWLIAEAWAVTRATALGTLVFGSLSLFLSVSFLSRSFLLLFFGLALAGTLLLRTAVRFFLGKVRQRGRNLRHLVIVGCGPRALFLGAEIRKRSDLGYHLLGYIDDIPPTGPSTSDGETHLGSLEAVEEILASLPADEIIIALPVRSQYRTIARIIAAAEDRGLMVRIPTSLFELRLSKATVDHLDDLPMITLQPPMSSSDILVVKRLLDIVVSFTALVLLSPLFLVIAALIRLDSRGSVLFFQERVGQGMKRFRIVKFRTMVPEAEARMKELEASNEVAGAAFKMKNDPRVTRLGRVLRKLSLDELPQFWNVLKGDMSLVGPRPLPVRDFLRFEKRTQRRRFSVKPGLTCIWQVNGRHEIGFDEWMDLDLEYIDNWSLGLDLEIILKTLPAVLRGTGAN
ncbi:MAG TPA: sugar transferase [Thermoanaerobaculia bacterium]|nr:sugar transferase [Thermoanaerobaculia bacterium]HQP85474.1 sugar transferase [Thermoanaerobaculia bacterium]